MTGVQTCALPIYKEDGVATTAFEVSDMVWLPVSQVEEKLTFKDTRELWKKARERIEQLTINNKQIV